MTDVRSARDAAAAHRKVAEARARQVCAAHLADDACCRQPRSREQARNGDAHARFNAEDFTVPSHFETERTVVDGGQAVGWFERRVCDTAQMEPRVFELDPDARIGAITDPWPFPSELPPSRAQLGERH